MSDFATALNKLWPNGDQVVFGLRAGMIKSAPETFKKHNIISPLVLAHFMAQISHECGAGHDLVENLNYSPNRLMQVWPLHFNMSNVDQYAHQPQKLANYIYEPPQHRDLGNRPNTTDGWDYRGRGATNTTGRLGYQKVGQAVGVDFIANPDWLNKPDLFLECGLVDFILCGCVPYAEKDDSIMVTKKLNGGLVGLSERKFWLNKWKAENIPVPT
jgi:putative chitinase